VQPAPELAAFLIQERSRIEAAMDASMGPAAPAPGAPESEVLRRFRAYAASSIHRGGKLAAPALDGLRAHEKRTTALLDCWAETAAQLSGKHAGKLRAALSPLIQEFQNALRSSGLERSNRGRPRAQRRAVTAAIDRISDAFLAVDADTARIADANPSAGSLLGLQRDALLGVDLLSFVPAERHADWWIELDAVCEGTEPRRFRTQLKDVRHQRVEVECAITRFETRNRSLALVVARTPELGAKRLPDTR